MSGATSYTLTVYNQNAVCAFSSLSLSFSFLPFTFVPFVSFPFLLFFPFCPIPLSILGCHLHRNIVIERDRLLYSQLDCLHYLQCLPYHRCVTLLRREHHSSDHLGRPHYFHYTDAVYPPLLLVFLCQQHWCHWIHLPDFQPVPEIFFFFFSFSLLLD